MGKREDRGSPNLFKKKIKKTPHPHSIFFNSLLAELFMN
jgi:hypothetical protein